MRWMVRGICRVHVKEENAHYARKEGGYLEPECTYDLELKLHRQSREVVKLLKIMIRRLAEFSKTLEGSCQFISDLAIVN